MTGPSRALRLFGTEEEPQPSRVLRAGPLSCVLRGGGLHHVRIGPHDVLRTLDVLLRDPDWGTPSPVAAETEVEEGPGRFRIVHRMRFAVRGAALAGRVEIRADATPSLELVFEGRAEGDVPTAKTGIVALHPASAAGAPVEVRHAAGGVRRARFPEAVSAQQPFTDIAAIAHQVAPGLWADLAFEGDVFEMEDQRNYTDASFKTYNRPLDLPWPYVIASGSVVRQAARLGFRGMLPVASTLPDGGARVVLGTGGAGTMPEIGLAAAPAGARAALAKAPVLKAARPSFLLGQHDPGAGHCPGDLAVLADLARALGAPVALEIVLPSHAAPGVELGTIAAGLAAAGLRPRFVTLVPAADVRGYGPAASAPPAAPADRILAEGRTAFPGVAVGGGTLGDFWLLNLAPPPPGFDHVSHGTCAIHHVADDAAAMETLDTLPRLAASVRALAHGAAYRVGPGHIGLRHNHFGAATAPNPGSRRVPGAREDPRQRGLFGAAFALGHIAALARAGAASVVPAGLVHAFGIAHAPATFAQPWFDDQAPGSLFPVFHVVRGLAHHAGASLIGVEAARGIGALAFATPRATELWLANLTDAAQDVTIAGAPPGPAHLAVLDEDAFVPAATDPGFLDRDTPEAAGAVSVAPYAIARLRWPR